MDSLSFLSNAEIGTVEELYQQFRHSPQSIDPTWQQFFEGFEFAQRYNGNGHAPAEAGTTADATALRKEAAVLALIDAYRTRGHLFAQINPILPRKKYEPDLNLQQFGLNDSDLNTPFAAGSQLGMPNARLADILDFLKRTYCGSVGLEYRFIRIPEIVDWMHERFEARFAQHQFSAEAKRGFLAKLFEASSFEQFIHRKFPGQKRFSCEGGESIIPALDVLVQHGATLGVKEFIIGMAHRGRLSVLTSILKKEPDSVFGEFKDKGVADDVFEGDVKYHLSHSSDVVLPNGHKVHLSLAPNPSHLDAVDPVVEGMARAKLENLYGGDETQICPILIHGDASLSGQGIVYEIIQMSRLNGFGVGGTVHFVINNQVGFTTNPADGRSSTYCTDVAKVTLSPVFHVNGDDPEALAFVTQLAMEFRQQFRRDVFIDIYGYRKYGHNEGDEPRFTQPLMYAAIDKHPGPYTVYANKLMAENVVTAAELEAMQAQRNAYLTDELDQSDANTYEEKLRTTPERVWGGLRFYDPNTLEAHPATGVELKKLKQYAENLTALPPGFVPHRNVERLMAQRHEMVFKTNSLDWGMGETLAYASLLAEGFPVRLTGQDVQRGTFSHRHAVLFHQTEADVTHTPLNHVAPGQARFSIYNSLLSEYGVLGFETGYSMAAPKTLTLWEAQFGDFVNGAQIVIDQFICTATTKWHRLLGLVLLLPHGHEGQGPEHTSARPERFLQLCAGNNMYVANLTTPANLFHALRRQLHTDTRRPLVILTPKSLLRSPQATSPLEDFGPKTHFQPVLDDPSADPKKVTRVVLATGKVALDLLRNRDQHKLANTAIVRLEQLYPLPMAELEAIRKRFAKAKEWLWCQEEPLNMGYWSHLMLYLHDWGLQPVARKPSGSPATGSKNQHDRQQQFIVRKALNLAPDAQVA